MKTTTNYGELTVLHSETLYRKVLDEGGEERFEAIAERAPDLLFPHGRHLIHSREGVVSRLYNLPASSIDLLSLVLPFRDELVRQLVNRVGLLQDFSFSPEQGKEWASFVAAMGGVIPPLSFETACELVDATIHEISMKEKSSTQWEFTTGDALEI